MPPEIPGYVYGGSYTIEQLCGLFHDPESELNDAISDAGINGTVKNISCAGITLVGAGATAYGVLAGWQGFTVVGTVCAGSYIGCLINDAIRNNTPCGAQILDIYVSENLNEGTAGRVDVIAVIRCNKNISDDADQIVNDISTELEDAADEAADVTIETGQDIAADLKDAAESIEDIADDIINSGQDILF